MHGRTLLFAAITIGTLSCAATAAAKNHYVFQGKPAGVYFKKGTAPLPPGRPLLRVGPSPLAPLVTCPQTKPNPACNMTYHNGAVLHTNTTHVIYWQPSGFNFQNNYGTLAERFLGDVAADGGRATNPYATDTQYSDSTNGDILYQQAYAGSMTDNTAFPARNASCALQGAATVCLTQTQETDELDAFIQNKGLPRGLNDIYFLVLPINVQTCFDDFSDCGPYGGITDSAGVFHEYCAYHSAFNKGNGITAWANMPDGADSNCNIVPTAPNNTAADTLIDTLSHEHNETITDPNATTDSSGVTTGGWFDVNLTGENGDKCNDTFGPNIGTTPTGAGFDVLINHNPYEIQPEWDNSITGCSMTFGAVAPTAAFTSSPASPHALDTVNFDGSGSQSNDTGGYIIKYSWDFGDSASTSSTTSSSASHSYASAGTYTVTLTVTDDAGKTAQVSHDVVVVTRPTTLTYNGATSGDYRDSVSLSGTLTDTATAAPIANEQISFSVGSKGCTGNTDANGHAHCSVTLGDTAGSYTASASFTTDGVYSSSSDSASFTISTEETSISYTGPVVILAGAQGATLTAKLVEDGSNDNDGDGGSPGPVPQETVTLQLGSSSCTGKTDSAGKASCQLTATGALGSQTLSASFAGDGYYTRSSASTSAIVFAFPSRGAFTLGDATAGSAAQSGATVTWWADTWSSLNSLSGGAAPSADKGFAATVSLPSSTPPAACGSSWSTSTGNSPPPTSGVPSYMGVLVTSQVTKNKNGSTISGNTVHIVVVKINPGYAPDPSHHGTGVIVATYC
jgi:PKD repeat protein